MSKQFIYNITGVVLLILLSQCSNKPTAKYKNDIDNIAEAVNIIKTYGGKLWPNYNKISYSTLLVTDSIEFLFNHPEPGKEFKPNGYSNKLNTEVYTRDITLNRGILACFGIDKIPTAIVGTPKNTDRSGVEWIITLVHEYFHQYQSTSEYYKMVDELDLKGDCKTGMWMLNYAFPYENSEVKQQFRRYSEALHRLILSLDSGNVNRLFNEYMEERNKFRLLLSDKDYRYFTFQVWQEGMARYTEYKILHLLLNEPERNTKLQYPTNAYREYMNRLFKRETNRLKNSSLDKQKRVCFYTIGFAEGLLLDRINPEWRQQYTKELSIDNMIKQKNHE